MGDDFPTYTGRGGDIEEEQNEKFVKRQQRKSSSAQTAKNVGIGIGTGIILAIIIAGFIMAAWDLSWIKNHDTQCKPQKVNQFALTNRFPDTKRTDWRQWSRDISSTRHNPHLPKVTSGTVRKIQNICNLGTTSSLNISSQLRVGVSTTFTMDNELNMIFFTDWGNTTNEDGRVYAVDAATCDIVWEKTIQSLGVIANIPGNDPVGIDNPYAISRNSPTVVQNRTGGINLIFADLGTNLNPLFNQTNCDLYEANATLSQCGARVYCVEATTGKLLWRTLVKETSPIGSYSRQSDMITSSPNVFADSAIFGMSSSQSSTVSFTGFLNFYGRYFSIDINNGAIQWIKRTTSDAQIEAGNYGASAWSSNPPIDIESQQVFFGTSNLYNYSTSVVNCLVAGHTRQYCMEDGIVDDSVIGARLNNDGERTWIQSPMGVDAWNTACVGLGTQAVCPVKFGPDYDFGTGGTIIQNECGQRYLIMFEKSGILYSFDVETGAEKWRTYVGPGTFLVPSWGISFDGENIYLSDGNFARRNFLMLDGTLRCDGFWAAINAWSGKIKWMTAVPCSRSSEQCIAANGANVFIDPELANLIPANKLDYSDRFPQKSGAALPCYGTASEDIRNDPTFGASASGGIVTTNNLMFAGSYTGYMHVFNKNNGKIIQDLPRCSTGVIYGGASLAMMDNNQQTIAWGCGYGRLAITFPLAVGDNEVFIMKIPTN